MSESDHSPADESAASASEATSTESAEIRGDEDGDSDSDLLRARVRRLEEANRRLRDQYAGVRERRYRRTALGLAVVGVVFGLTGLVVTEAQDVLFAIAAAGLFGAVLTRFLTPEQFIPLDIGEGTYAALAENEAALADQLGLSSTRVYVTTDRGPRLFVPELDAYDDALLDDPDALAEPLVVGDDASRSGLSLRPAAEPLLRAFEQQHRGTLPADPQEAVATLREAVTDALELAGGVDVDLDSDDGRVTFSLSDPLYGDTTQFDHPIGSFLGAGLATALGTPIEVDVVTVERDGTVTPLVTCRWDPDRLDDDRRETDASSTESGERDEVQ